MNLLAYYISHSFINQIKKIFRTWVVIFFLICVLVGAGVGLLVGTLQKQAKEKEEAAQTEEVQTEEEAPGFHLTLPEGVEKRDAVEAVAGAMIIALLAFCAVNADTHGSKLFLPASDILSRICSVINNEVWAWDTAGHLRFCGNGHRVHVQSAYSDISVLLCGFCTRKKKVYQDRSLFYSGAFCCFMFCLFDDEWTQYCCGDRIHEPQGEQVCSGIWMDQRNGNVFHRRQLPCCDNMYASFSGYDDRTDLCYIQNAP